jgi:hypothetical protein
MFIVNFLIIIFITIVTRHEYYFTLSLNIDVSAEQQ